MTRSEFHAGGPGSSLADADCLDCLVWRFDAPMLAASTASVGGGIGLRSWVVNAQVVHGYGRLDPDEHVGQIAERLGLRGAGIGMLTAADVADVRVGVDEGVHVEATVGLSRPVWAAAPEEVGAARLGPGTINVVAVVAARHGDAALANMLCTVTEAKVQALLDGGVDGTGTASDAVSVLCPAAGTPEPFGGPRSNFGAPLARAVYAAVRAGMDAA